MGLGWLKKSHNCTLRLFTTNGSGGFEERTFVDDIRSRDYKIKFIDDADTNDRLDSNKTELSLYLSIPCKNQ